MLPQSLSEFRAATRRCTAELAENAVYIERELPSVHLLPELRAKVIDLCHTLIGTQHDLDSELDDWLHASSTGAQSDASRIDRLVRWLQADLDAINDLVDRLHVAAEQEPGCSLACLLVTESATNILQAAAAMSNAAELHRKQVPGSMQEP